MSNLKDYYTTYIEELQEALGDFKIPKLITELIDFDYTIDGERYHERFELRIDEDILECTLEANDADEEKTKPITEQLLFFANADIEGSCYAFWLSECDDVNNAPIIYLTTDAQQEVVASNLEDLIILLTTGKTYFTYDDNELNDYVTELPAFRKWVKEHLGLEPLTNDTRRKEIQDKAKTDYQEKFNRWLTKNGADFLVEE